MFMPHYFETFAIGEKETYLPNDDAPELEFRNMLRPASFTVCPKLNCKLVALIPIHFFFNRNNAPVKYDMKL